MDDPLPYYLENVKVLIKQKMFSETSICILLRGWSFRGQKVSRLEVFKARSFRGQKYSRPEVFGARNFRGLTVSKLEVSRLEVSF